MQTWNYFRWITLIWGILAIITKPVFFNLLGKRWQNWLQNSAYTVERRPTWILWAAAASLALIAYTWYRVYIDTVPYDWVIALLMTVSLVKIIVLVFDYPKFQAWVTATLEDTRKQNQMVWSVTIVGLILITTAFWLY